MKRLYVKKVATGRAGSKTIPVTIDDVETWVEADSGADVNLMDSDQFKAFLQGTREPPRLQDSSIRLYNLQARLLVKGCLETTVRNATCGIKT